MRKGKRSSIILSRLLFTIKIAFVFSCLYVSIIGVKQIDFARAFPFSTVKIYGIQEIDQAEIKAIVTPFLQSGFFAMNLEELHDKLTHNPWVSQAVVRRKWPDELCITIIERVPVANWNNQALLSNDGELFNPVNKIHYSKNLPLLVGPPNQHVLMLGYLQNINRLLNPIHARIHELDLNAYATWKLTLDNGIVLYIGYKDVLTRVSQFTKVYSKLLNAEKGDIASVDLRYPNGMAVKWVDHNL